VRAAAAAAAAAATIVSPLPSRLRLHFLDLLAADVYRLENLPCPVLTVRAFPVVRIGVSVRNRVKDPFSCAGVYLRTADTEIRLGRGFWLIGRRRCLCLVWSFFFLMLNIRISNFAFEAAGTWTSMNPRICGSVTVVCSYDNSCLLVISG
jgi:hypothetical protein